MKFSQRVEPKYTAKLRNIIDLETNISVITPGE
jgi:hypothetical protein